MSNGSARIVRKRREDRRVSRSRQQLQEALRALVLEKEYDRITVQEILDRAGVGRATFYAHFRDKDELMLSRFEAVRESLREHLERVLRRSDPSAMVLAIFQHADGHRREYRALLGSRTGNTILRRVHRELTRLVRAHFEEAVGQRRVAVPVEIAAEYAVSALVALLTRWLERDRKHDARQMAEMYQRMTLPAIAAALR
jgi:AcrR family transcriptional regulator